MSLNLLNIHKSGNSSKINKSLFVPKYLKKILKIFANFYKPRYCVAMIQIFDFLKKIESEISADVIAPPKSTGKCQIKLILDNSKLPYLFSSLPALTNSR